MSEPITVTEAQQAPAPPPNVEVMKIQNERALAAFDDPFESAAALRHFTSVAEFFSKSIFVPDHFRGKVGDCLIAINLAKRMDEDPLQVMQNTFVVGGRPGFYTAFMIARANRRAGFKSKIRWTVEQLAPATLESGGTKFPNLKVTALAVDGFGEQIDASVDTAMAIAEGWTKNAKYRSMCEHMMKWRAAAFLIRLYAPEVMMGMPTVEEVETMPPPVVTIDPNSGGVSRVEALLGIAEKSPEPATVGAPTEGGVADGLSPAQVDKLRGDIFADVNRVITTLAETAQKAPSEAPVESLFDEGSGKKAKK